MASLYAFLAAIILVVCSLPSRSTAQGIVEITGTQSTSLVFGAGTSIVTVKNAVFPGTSITFNIGLMMSSRQPVVIEICSVTMSGGAIFYFIGAADVTGKMPAYIHITQVTGTDSGFGFGGGGSFPLYSRIIATHVKFTINSGSAGYSGMSSFCPCTPTCLLFGGLTLKKTVFRFSNSTINGALRNGLFPIRFNSFVVTDYSYWLMDNVYIGNSFAFHGHSPVVSSNSIFHISKVNAVCDRFCISFEGGLTVESQSAFVIDYSSASADGHDLMYISGAVSLSGNSLFLQKDNFFITPRYAFSVSGGYSASSGSVVSFVNNNLLGLPWHGGACSGSCYAQCNALGMAQLSTKPQYSTAGLNGLTTAFACNLRTSCPDTVAGCFAPLTNTAVAPSAGKCCTCLRGGYGPYCLPVEVPFVPQMCVSTVTKAKLTETMTSTLSEQVSMSLTKVNAAKPNKIKSESLSVTVTVAQSKSVSPSSSAMISVTSTFHKLSKTHIPSPTQTEMSSLTQMPTPSLSRSATVTSSITVTDTVTDTVNHSASSTFSPNVTTSETLSTTTSRTVTQSFSQTESDTYTVTMSTTLTPTDPGCIWDRSTLENPRTYGKIQCTPFTPLAMTQGNAGNNFTMSIPYANAFNGYHFTVSSLGQWRVFDHSTTGETAGAVVDNMTIIGIDDAYTVAVSPPRERYTSILLRQVTVTITFHCATTFHTEDFVIVILPEQPVVQQGVVNDILASALAGGIIVASPPVAAAAAWAMIFMEIMLCQNLGENSAISFTGLTIGDDSPRYLRGAIVANLLIVAAQAVVVMAIGGVVVVLVRSGYPKQQFQRALAVLQWPNVMHISIGALMLLTMTASVALLCNAVRPVDYLLGVIGAAGCTGYTISICYRLYEAHQLSRGKNRRWQVAQSLGSKHFVFGNYKRPWFAGYETANNWFVGIIAGLPAGSTICSLQMWVVWVASIVIICIIVFFRPMKTRLSLIFVLAIQVLTFLAANAVLVSRYVPSQRNGALNAATVLLLVIPLVALLKAITDIVAFVTTGRALAKQLLSVDASLLDMDADEDGSDSDDGLAKKPTEAEGDELSEFLLAIDAPSTVQKRQAKPSLAPSDEFPVTPVDEPHAPPAAPRQQQPLNEDDIFASLGI